MSELTGVRWTRYGKDRLYVKDADGGDVGWVDLLTGTRAIAIAGLDAQIDELVAQHREGRELRAVMPTEPAPVAAVPPQPVAPDPVAPAPPQPLPAPQASEPEWHDLATNVPGQAARARAEEELAAMRERSRVGTWVARALDMKTDERAWRVGADGEETIGGKLDKLTKHGWYVLHSVPVGKADSDIDHVLVGPGGVYTINTKKHPGKKVWVGRTSILVNGQRTDYLRNSRFEGERASTLLTSAVGFPVVVKPALIFITGTLVPDVTIKELPDGVAILDRMDIPRVFRRASAKLTPEQVETIYAAARRSTTWSTR
jgi:hypothetical protein